MKRFIIMFGAGSLTLVVATIPITLMLGMNAIKPDSKLSADELVAFTVGAAISTVWCVGVVTKLMAEIKKVIEH